MQTSAKEPETAVTVADEESKAASETETNDLEVKKEPGADDKLKADGPADEAFDLLDPEHPAYETFKAIFEKFGSFGDDDVARSQRVVCPRYFRTFAAYSWISSRRRWRACRGSHTGRRISTKSMRQRITLPTGVTSFL